MNILAIDSATEACSAALQRADGEVFGEFEVAPRQHARLLPEMLQRILARADLPRANIAYCAFTNGPGAFTGIRIAAAQAQGLGIGLGIPLVPLSTLAVLAQTAFERHHWTSTVAALDARMQEIYWGRYDRDAQGCACLQGRERLGSAADLEAERTPETGAGHGWLEELRTNADFPLDPELLPDARAMLPLARREIDQQRYCAPQSIRINYLRNRVAEKARS